MAKIIPNLLAPPPPTQLEALRGLVRRTIETYSLPWIVVNEAIQNALDAVEKGAVSEGEITVDFYLDSNEIAVKDNGRGFPFDPELKLFFWGGTDKEFDRASTRLLGYQGVGLKVILFSSKSFELDTVYKKKRWILKILDGYRYESSNEVVPVVNGPEPTNSPSGSLVKYSFPDKKVREFFIQLFIQYQGRIGDNLANTKPAKFLLGLEHFFRTYTYAGNLDRLLGLRNAPKKSLITMRIHWSKIPKKIPEQLRAILQESASPLKFTFENKHWDLEEILNRVTSPYRARRPGTISFEIPPDGYTGRYGPRYVYVRKFTRLTQFQRLITNIRARRTADVAYYQRYLFPRMNGVYLVVGAREVLSDYLFANVERQQFVCAQGGAPTEHKIKEPSESGELGYLPNIYLGVSTNAKLSYGKRQITDPWLLGYVNNYFNDAFRLTLRDIARAFVGRLLPITPPPSPPTDIVGLQEITSVPGIAKVPADENMLIAIFYALVGAGHVEGLKTYYLSSKTPYDGKVIIKTGSTFPSPNIDQHLQTMEFKLSLAELIDQLDRGIKIPNDIDLIVCWEDDYSALPITKQLPDYGVEDTQQFTDIPQAIKKLVARHVPREIPIITVRELIIAKFGHI